MSPEGFPIEGCQLDTPQLGAQLRRYRRLARHATSVQRRPGEVLVKFDGNLPAGLLERTMEVERGRLTVENIDEDPRLDSLHHALSSAKAPETQCCEPAILATCCAAASKADCCGTTDGPAPTSCGCGTESF